MKFLPRENIFPKNFFFIKPQPSPALYIILETISPLYKLALINKTMFSIISNSSNVHTYIARTHPRVRTFISQNNFIPVYLLRIQLFFGECIKCLTIWLVFVCIWRGFFFISVTIIHMYDEIPGVMEEYCSSISCFLVFLVFCFASIQNYIRIPNYPFYLIWMCRLLVEEWENIHETIVKTWQ